ncbi:MAG: hypothetical protein HQM10_19045 [Candidatus Riflebacteria bacterium]|nr:hypothetical protein [Candidatus Riflebacteria bacterium]
MKLLLRSVIFLFGVSLVFLPLMAIAADENIQSKVHKLMEVHGINQLAKDVSGLFLQTFDNDSESGKITKQLGSLLKQMVLEAYDSEKIKKVYAESIIANLTEDKVVKLIEEAEKPLSKKITQMELEANNPANFNDLQKFLIEIQNKPLPKERIEIIQKLEDVCQGVQMNIDLVSNIQLAVARGVNMALPIEAQQKDDELKKKANAYLEQIIPTLKQQSFLTYLFAYKNATDAELNEYVQFYSSELGMEYAKVSRKAFMDAMNACADELGNLLGKSLVTVKKEEKK